MLNVVLIGFILIGPHPFGPRAHKPPSPDKIFSHMARGLNEADREVFQKVLVKHRDNLKMSHTDMDKAFGEIKKAVRAHPFEIEKVTEAQLLLSLQRRKIDQAIEGFMIEVLTEISPDGRQKLKIGPPGPPPPRP